MHHPQESISLFELNALVRSCLEQQVGGTYRVRAELSEVRLSAKGHCFVELIQKDERQHVPVAKARGVIMSDVYLLLAMDFEHITGQSLHAGLEILMQVRPTFSEVYGYSLIIDDIDPTFTLGDMARRRQEILRRLEEEGVAEMQHELQLPMVVQRIAVISSPTAAGWGDFQHQLQHNAAGYRFQVELFPAMMQGNEVEQSIISALEHIAQRQDEFDAVVIIRGGGAVSDLSGFETYELATHVVQFPLPVITGIGHQRDQTVLDLVSHLSLKTPTAVSDFLITRMDGLSQQLAQMQHALYRLCNARLQSERLRMAHLREAIGQSAQRCLMNEKHRLELLSQRIAMNDPQRILNMGYSLTLLNGRAVRRASDLKPGMRLNTHLAEGEIQSIVTEESQ
ncbi:MAG: exodeoxyribonuclease VII large subunit [Bacteroidaceae bacterium]|nr:exodeoxyribonuclease VII large subunit [Bacteroidaceae bacterium]